METILIHVIIYNLSNKYINKKDKDKKRKKKIETWGEKARSYS